MPFEARRVMIQKEEFVSLALAPEEQGGEIISESGGDFPRNLHSPSSCITCGLMRQNSATARSPVPYRREMDNGQMKKEWFRPEGRSGSFPWDDG
ncbi:hypothetical protein [Mesorhizobium temperatum]|uniref:hypothetical protein n=1 Tax=Mesorhizobium temperatum TaxID=241416 RepID=UPI00117E3CAA|nr:hypothetical protein [Mesorhizobium temperatum]